MTLAVDTTSALLDSGTGLSIAGAYDAEASQTSSLTTVATGATQGSNVAVGASVALTTAVDTVSATLAQDLAAGGAVTLKATNLSGTSASATASVAGGATADSSGNATDGSGGAGKSVDQQVAAQSNAADTAGDAAGSDASTKLADNKPTTPSASSSDGAVSVAAAVGVNVDTATTTAAIGEGLTVTSGGLLTLAGSNQTSGTAKADGSQTGTSSVGVGAAVALNLAVSTNTATIAAGDVVKAQGVTLSATEATGQTSTYDVEATSGAGGGKVGVAGSLAVNTVVNTAAATLAGADSLTSQAAASVDAGSSTTPGDVSLTASSTTSSTVKADAKVTVSGSSAEVGVGASVGMNIAVNTTTAEIDKNVVLTDAGNLTLGATASHTLDTEVSGGAAGAKISITPTAAVTLAVDTTLANVDSGTALAIGGAYDAEASQTTAMTTTATGATQGSNVAVGASLALTTAVDTVSATLARNLDAGSDVTLKATTMSGTSTSATASAAGGAPADSSGNATDGSGGAGTSVDGQVAAQSSAADTAGDAAGSDASTQLSGNKQTAPSAQSNGAAVTVAAAIAVNVDVSTASAALDPSLTVTSGGKLTLASAGQMAASATADGSQSGDTRVGVGAAVALNVGTSTSQSLIGDGAKVTSQGLTLTSLMPTAAPASTFGASATSGAGASNVGVAGSLALNVVINSHEAEVQGQTLGTTVNAGSGDVLVQAADVDTSTATGAAQVAAASSGSSSKVGVGATLAVNVVVDSTLAELTDGAALTSAGGVTVQADATHTLTTTATGGAAGASVSITPLAAVAVSLNTTTASLGTSATTMDLTGALSLQADQTDTVTTTATGQTVGDVAVGASLAATVAMDHDSASLNRSVSGATAIGLEASSGTALTTTASASAKGAETKNDPSDSSKPAAGTTPDEQKDAQLQSAADENSATAGVDMTDKTKTATATTPSTNTDDSGSSSTKQSGAKVSVAAAIGVAVAENQAEASIGSNLTLSTSGSLGIQATTRTDYATQATGAAVSDKVGIAAAVALTATLNTTQASLGAGTHVTQAGDITVAATSSQNMDAGFLAKTTSTSISGASGGTVAVAGSLAVVANANDTEASIGAGVILGSSASPVGDVAVTSDDTSRISAQALAGALNTGSSSEAGVGASFAVLLASNQTTATVGDATGASTTIDADSLTVTATKHPVQLTVPFTLDLDNTSTDYLTTLANPATYLSQVSDYTEAVAGAASQGDAAVAGAFSVNVFGNTTEASLNNATVITTGTAASGKGVQVASVADTDAVAVAGAVGVAKQAGVGLSNTDIVNSDQVLASMTSATVTSQGSVQVDAEARQNLVNVSISGGVGTSSTGVGGVLGVVVTMNQVAASIGAGSSVKSEGGVAVTAGNDTLSVMAAGGIGAGDSVGVGASIAANIIKNDTFASIANDVVVDAAGALTVAAQASETAATAVVAGAASGNVAVSGGVSVDTLMTTTEATVGQGAKLNQDAGYNGGAGQTVSVTATDGSTIVGLAGALAAASSVGVGASIDTAVLAKTVKATLADDADGADPTKVQAAQSVAVGASSTDSVVSVTLGFGGGGDVGVGGAVGVTVLSNQVLAEVGQNAQVASGGNVLVTAQDDITGVLTAGGIGVAGTAGVGAALAVATLLGSTKAIIGAGAQVDAGGSATSAAAMVYDGDTSKGTEQAKGLAVTAYTDETLITTDVSGAVGGTAGVAGTVDADVIASDTEATIGSGARINQSSGKAGGKDQQVIVQAVDATVLTNASGGLGGGGTAGVGASLNVAVVDKTTLAEIGTGVQIDAVKAVDLGAASSEVTVDSTLGFGGGGVAGVAGALGAIGVADSTRAIIDDGTASVAGAVITVSQGDLDVKASDLSTSTLSTATLAIGGTAGVGAALAAAVNTSQTEARIGDYTITNAAGATDVEATSLENVNTITVNGAGGGVAGVAGTVSVNVIASGTEAAIGQHAQVNQTVTPNADQSVQVNATDSIVSVGAAGSVTGGGAAGVGGTANVTYVENTTSAFIDSGAAVDAKGDVTVAASSTKTLTSDTLAGAGGGAAGVAGAVSVLAVGSLLDGQANSGLGSNTSSTLDSATGTSSVGSQLGSSSQSQATTQVLDGSDSKLAVSGHMADTTQTRLAGTQAFIGSVDGTSGGATVNAGGNLQVSASDTGVAVVTATALTGGGAAGVGVTAGVVLLHDSASAFVADGSVLNAGKQLSVDAGTSDQVYNVAIAGGGAGAAAVNGILSVNVVSSDTSAAIGAAQVNQDSTFQSPDQSVAVAATSASVLVSAAAGGGGAGAASVGAVLNTNVLTKDTQAFIADGAKVEAQNTVAVSATSSEDIINAGLFISGAGAAAVSGVASANYVADTTDAHLGVAWGAAAGIGTTVDSAGNVDLSAADDTLMVTTSAVGNGAGAAAVGGNVDANVIINTTLAYVSDKSTVNALGQAAGVAVYDGGQSSTAGSLPSTPGGQSGSVNTSGGSSPDANLSSGSSVNLTDNQGNTQDTSNGLSGQTPTAAAGGLNAKTTVSGVKGLSITAVADEKIIPVTISVAGAGAAAVTASASANVVGDDTEATVGDGVKINTGTTATGQSMASPTVRLVAADNTLLVQTAGTMAGAGAAAVSGAVNVGIVNKTTKATLGDAQVQAGDVSVQAVSSEDVYSIGANVSVAGGAGAGAAVGVDSIHNTTTASIGAGANLDASGDLTVTANEQSAITLYSVSGAGGIVGVSGALSVGVIDNTTQAFVADATLANPTILNAGGTTDVAASSSEAITTATVSAAGGGVGVAGAVSVKVVEATTQAYIGQYVDVNQGTTGTRQDVEVTATDSVTLGGGAGSAAMAGIAVGAGADIDVVRNTTSAYLGSDSKVSATQDVTVQATSTRDVGSVVVAAAGLGAVGVSGAVAVAVIGADLNGDATGSISSGNGSTASSADGEISSDQVSGKLGSSSEVSAMQGQISTRTQALNVSGSLDDSTITTPESDLANPSTPTADTTQAFIGSGAVVHAGAALKVAATDHTAVALVTTGAAEGEIAGLGGAVGIAIVNDTTQAFIAGSAQVSGGASLDVDAQSDSAAGKGYSLVSSAAGSAGGIIGLSAAVATLVDTSTTQAYVASGAQVTGAASAVTVEASTSHADETVSAGAAAGGLAVGGSVAATTYTGTTDASVLGSVTADSLGITAGDSSTATAMATAGTAGIYSGAGAGAGAAVTSTVDAELGASTKAILSGALTISATGSAGSRADAYGVSAGAEAVGVSAAVADTSSTVTAAVGAGSQVAASAMSLTAQEEVSTLRADPLDATSALINASAGSTAATGGLVGLNGSTSTALFTGTITSNVGAGSNLAVTGTVSLQALDGTRQNAYATGVVGGLLALGEDIASAGSTTTTQATLGSLATVTAGALTLNADGTDNNFAEAISGSGGVIAGSAAEALTFNTSTTYAGTGSGDSSHAVTVDDLSITASHTALFNGVVDSVNAGLVGASGALADHEVSSSVQAEIGAGGVVTASSVTITATNTVDKDWLLPGGWDQSTTTDTPADAALWNVDSGSGGALDAAGGLSVTNLNLQATTADVGNGAVVEVTVPVSGLDGVFTMNAHNVLTVHDKVDLNAGGAIALAEAASIVNADNTANGNAVITATASFGQNARVTSAQGDIDAGSWSTVDLNTLADADTYGLAGAPAGQAYSHYNGLNQTLVQTGAELLSSNGGFNLAAGESSSGALTTVTAISNVNLWNKTAIPIATTPDAQSNITSNALLDIAACSDPSVIALRASGDINLTADKGTETATATGIGKNIYLELAAEVASAISELFGGSSVSFDIQGGTTAVSGQSTVQVDGVAQTGINRNVTFTMDASDIKTDANGKVTWTLNTTADGLTFDPSTDIQFSVSIGQAIYDRIALLRNLSSQYAGTVAAGAYDAEISFLEQKLVDLGLAKYVTVTDSTTGTTTTSLVLGSGGAAGVSPKAAALALAASLQTQSDALVQPVASALTAKNQADGDAGTALSIYSTDSTTNLNLFGQRNTDAQYWAAAITNNDAASAATYKADVIADELALTNAKFTVTTPTTTTTTVPPKMAALNDYNTYNNTVVAQAYSTMNSTAATAGKADSAYSTLYDQKGAIDTSVNNLTTEAASLSNVAPVGASADYVTVPDITVKLGSINVKGDVLKGTGELLAPGDAKVTITNNTPDFLSVGNITVDSDAARVTLNGVAVTSNAEINAKNSTKTGANFLSIVTGAEAAPVVDIESNYDPNATGQVLTGPAPDITLTGTITNTQGQVIVHSAAGSINAQGSILAGSVDIKASNGDFVQSYVNGFDNIGGDPETIWENAQKGVSSVGTGILANGSVLISARYLNINGTIQSGIADYTLTLPTASAMIVTGSATELGVSASAIAAYLSSYSNQTAAAPVSATTTFTNDAGLAVTYNAVSGQLTMTGAEAVLDAASTQGRLRNPSGDYAVVTASTDTITASYDAVNNRYVVNSTQVMGGYIQLYGQIMNTANPAAGTGTGELKVLDGYGQINITNPSSLDLVLSALDTGKGVAGVINITDIQYVDSSEKAHSINTVITRDNGVITTAQTGGWVTNPSTGVATFSDTVTQTSTSASAGDASTTTLDSGNSRLATYSPQAGLEYVYTTGFNSSTITDYDYSGTQFFGSSNLRLDGSLATLGSAVAGPYQLTAQQMANGTYLAQATGSTPYYSFTTVTTPTADPVYTVTASWTSSNWWDFDITQTYHIDYTKVQALQTITTNVLRADNAIGIDFIGYSTGAVTVNSASNVTLTGAINNKTGTTSITAGNSGTGVTAADQNIVQGNGTALISTANLNLTASGSIGSVTVGSTAGSAVRVAASGIVNATATDGDVVLKGAMSSLNVGTIKAGTTSSIDASHGQVVLDADQSITAASAGSYVQGEGITLTAEDGSIGSIANPLAIQVGYTDDSTLRLSEGLKAQATGDIGIASTAWSANQDADLLVNTVVSLGGDVSLSTPGRIIDNNPNQQTDTRVWQSLVDYWNSVGLVAGSAQNAAQQAAVVAAYNNSRTQDYDLYWQIRDTQADPKVYDPGFVYTSSAAEAAALTAAGVNVATFDANRTAQYHSLNAEVGTLTTSYNPAFKYVATTAETAPLLAGSSWTTAELALSVTPGLLKNITDTNPVLKDPNVKGNHVTLNAGVAIGETQTPIEIDLVSGFTVASLTDVQKEALAAAEASDVVYRTVNGVDEILIYPRKPVNFAAATSLSATVTGTAVAGTADDASNQDLGNLFLASQGNAILDTIAATGQARIKVLGSISNESASSPAVQTGDLVLEAAYGAIVNAGAEPVRLDLLPGATLTARAEDAIDLVETSGDLNVSTVFSTQDVKLATTQGAISNGFQPFALNVLAGTVELNATGGSIGATGRALDVATNLDGGVTADASGAVTLYSPAGNPFHVAEISSGDAVQLTSAGTLSVEGAVSAVGAIGLVAGAELILTPEATIHTVATGVSMEAGAISLEAGTTGAASIVADSGAISATTYGYQEASGSTLITVPGTFTMADNGSHAASITASAGAVSITTLDDATITAITSGSTAADAVSITAGGHILAGHAAGGSHMDITADAVGAQLTLDGALGVGGEPLHLEVASLKVTSGGVTDLAVTGPVNIVDITSAGRVQLTASGSITGQGITSTGSGTGNTSEVDITTSTGDIANASVQAHTVNLTTQAGNIDAGAVTGTAVDLESAANVAGNTLQGTQVVIHAAGTEAIQAITTNGTLALTAGGTVTGTTLTGGDLDVTSTGGDIQIGAASGNAVTLTGGNVAGNTLHGATVVINARDSEAIQSITVSGTLDLTAAGTVTGTTLTGGDLDVTSTGGDIQIGAASGNAVTLTGGNVAGNTLHGATVVINARDSEAIQSITVSGTLDLTAAGTVTGTTLTGGDLDVTSTGGDIQIGAASGNAVTLTGGNVAGNTLDGAQVVIHARDSEAIQSITVSGSLDLTAAGKVTATTLTGGDLDVTSTAADIQFGTASGHTVAFTAGGNVTGGSLQAVTADLTAHDAVNVQTTNASQELDITAGQDITVAAITAPVMRLDSTGGNVLVGTATGDLIALSAQASVTGDSLNVATTLELASAQITANVHGGAQVVDGDITGYNGGQAANVKLTLDSPSGFAFSELWTRTGSVSDTEGWISSADTRIGARAAITNPITRVLVDQYDWSVQPCDVQLYSLWQPFSFRLAGNRVDSDAYVLYRGAQYEALAPSGNDNSDFAQTETALTMSNAHQALNLTGGMPPSPGSVPPLGAPSGAPHLVTYPDGEIPVATEGPNSTEGEGE